MCKYSCTCTTNGYSFMKQSFPTANVLSLSTKVSVVKTAWCLHCVRILCSKKTTVQGQKQVLYSEIYLSLYMSRYRSLYMSRSDL